jgi:hypothetical protein
MHRQTHAPRTVTCPECSKLFKSDRDVEKHLQYCTGTNAHEAITMAPMHMASASSELWAVHQQIKYHDEVDTEGIVVHHTSANYQGIREHYS